MVDGVTDNGANTVPNNGTAKNALLVVESSVDEHLSGRETAAILLMIFGEDEAADILTRLQPAEVQSLGEAMFAIRNVSEEDVNLVFDRFVERARSRTTIGYRADRQIKGMFDKALGTNRAATMLSRIIPQKEHVQFDQLKWMSADEIATMIAEEHPQMMAVVLSFLDPEMAGDTLQRLPVDIQDDVIFRVATMGSIPAAAFADIETLLSRQVQKPDVVICPKTGGTSEAAAIMNNVEKQAERRIIKALAKRDKAIARVIEEEMFVFTDLIDLEDKSLGTIIRSIDNAMLVLALKGATADLAVKMFSCMSKRAAQSIQDEIAEMAPVSKEDVIAAQKDIVAQARILAEEGKIVLGGQGDEFV
ncbi:MAG: flagellar motor switch protein FliG [Parasphingorhabdus sp.]|uniref:flagellar motor switch protein FliG n=1 Tax=Parasphingorhabdus sp. TaxID=2709688 RepID=UPI00300292D2